MAALTVRRFVVDTVERLLLNPCARMVKSSFTVIVVPDARSKVRRFTLSHKHLSRAAIALGALLLVGGGRFVHYLFVLGRAAQAVELADENLELKSQLRLVQE